MLDQTTVGIVMTSELACNVTEVATKLQRAAKSGRIVVRNMFLGLNRHLNLCYLPKFPNHSDNARPFSQPLRRYICYLNHIEINQHLPHRTPVLFLKSSVK